MVLKTQHFTGPHVVEKRMPEIHMKLCRIIRSSHFLDWSFLFGDYFCGVCDPHFLVASVAGVANPQERVVDIFTHL